MTTTRVKRKPRVWKAWAILSKRGKRVICASSWQDPDEITLFAGEHLIRVIITEEVKG